MARKHGHDRGLFERPARSGVWWIRYFDGDGRERREKVGPKALARKRYMQRKTEIAEGRYFPNARRRAVLVDELVGEYREAKRREGKAVMASEVGYRRLLERFGGRRADTIATGEVEEWRDDMRESLAPATVNLHLTILRAVLRLGMRNGRLEASAVPAIRGLKANNARVRYLTDDEESRLITALPKLLRPLITIALHTGMRRGELLNLTWDDIDFVSGTIFVRTSKSGEGRRLPMSPTAHRTLSALWQARRKRLSARVVRQSEAGRFVFAAPHGGFMLNLGRAWYPGLERAKLEGLHFHDLRHTFASRLVMNGVDLYRVQILMGHKTPAMTLRYAHLSPQHLRAAVATLDAPGPKPWSVACEQGAADS
jgi:integrase